MEVANSPKQRLWTNKLMWILIIQTMTALAYHGYASIIPFIQQEYMLSKLEVGYMTSAMFFGSCIIAIPSGIFTDRIGTKHTLTLFSMILVSVLYVFSITSSYIAIIFSLILYGIGYGGITPATNREIMDSFPLQNRGTAMGLKQMGVPLGVVIATFILPFLAKQFSWRISLFTIGNLLLLVSILYVFLYHNGISKKDVINQNYFNSLKNIVRNKKVILLAFIVSFYIAVQVSVTTFIVIYLYYDAQFSLFISTLCLAFVYCGGIFGRAIWGYISDRFFNRKRKKVLAFIGAFLGFVLFLLGFVNEMAPILFVYILSFFLGFTTQGWNGIFNIMLSESGSKTEVGLTSGVGLMITNLGAILGAPLSGVIIDVSGSYQMMWWILAIIMLGIAILTFSLNFRRLKQVN